MEIPDNEFQNRVESILKKLKFEKSVQPIFDGDREIGYLEPIQASEVNNRNIIRLLAEWREVSSNSFPTQFKVTEEGTRKWLDEQVINKDDRILFMIYSNDRIPIGHMGIDLFDYHHRLCYIDNVIRGEEEIKGIMTLAMKTLICWAFKELRLSSLNIRVFSENQRAIALYLRCGFEEIGRIPLERIKEEHTIKFVEIPYGSKKQPDRYFVLMSLQNPHIIKSDIGRKMILTVRPTAKSDTKEPTMKWSP